MALDDGDAARRAVDHDQPERDEAEREQEQQVVLDVRPERAVRRGGRRRGLGRRLRRHPRHLPRQTAERVAAVLVVPELVEAGAGGREQHGVARAGVGRGGLHGGCRGCPTARTATPRGVEGRGERSPPPGRSDRRRATGPAATASARLGEVGALQRAAQDQVDAGRERRQRLDRRVGVGRLGVVHELDAPRRRRPARSRCGSGANSRRARSTVGCVDADGPGGGGRRERVLEVVLAAEAGVLPVDRVSRLGRG